MRVNYTVLAAIAMTVFGLFLLWLAVAGPDVSLLLPAGACFIGTGIMARHLVRESRR